MLRPEIAKPHLLTVAEYMTADIHGRTELIGGNVYDVPPRNEPHRFSVRALNRILVKGLDESLSVQGQDAIAVPGWHGTDAPEVDLAIIADREYDPMPAAADALALIEVSDTTYRDDRNLKIPLYVQAGVPAWIVNVQKRQIEYYGSLEDLKLTHGRVFHEGETVDIAGVRFDVAAVLPKKSFGV